MTGGRATRWWAQPLPLAARSAAEVDTTTQVGSVLLDAPVLTAAGTSGHGAELAAFFDLSLLGAVVTKSVSADPWAGNPAPRVHATTAGMLNAVGLQGPGMAAWLRDDLPPLVAEGATVVASIWGHSVDDYARAAEAIATAPAGSVSAVEINLSCPNTEAGSHLFAHDPATSARVMAVTEACGLPRWAKLSPNTDRVVEVADAVAGAGAEAVVLVNTLMGMSIDTEKGRPRLGNGSGGLSGPAIHPVAVRIVHQVHAALPNLPIVGVGGVWSGVDAVELMMAGASAVEVGTATLDNPRAPLRVLDQVVAWCRAHHVSTTAELTGFAHRRPAQESQARSLRSC